MIHRFLARWSNGTQNSRSTGDKYRGVVSSASEWCPASENNQTDNTDSKILICGAIRHVIQFKAGTVLIRTLITATGWVSGDLWSSDLHVPLAGQLLVLGVPGCGCECLSTNIKVHTRSTSQVSI